MSEQTSFVDALKAKYCDDDTENAGCEHFVQITVFGNNRRRPRGGSAGDDGGSCSGSDGGGESVPELDYLKSVVLYSSGISHAAIPAAGLSSLCPNVSDLDLSGNLLKSWSEVMIILKHLPGLKFVNLSSNPLENWEIPNNRNISCSIEDLVLNDTKVSWSEVAALSRLMPKLKQLHLCKNDYNEIAFSGAEASNLCHLCMLVLNNNNIKRWDEVAKLKSLPQLHTLVLLENPLENVFYKQTGSGNPGDDDLGNTGTSGSEERGEGRLHGNTTDEGSGRWEESTSSSKEDKASEACSDDSLGKPTVGDEGLSDELNPDDGGAAEVTEGLPASDPRPGQSEDKQSVPQVNEGKSAVGDVDGSAETTRSKSGTSSVECNTTGDSHSTDGQASLSNKHQEISQYDKPADPGFQALESLCVTGTALSDWQHLHELRHFPKLHSVKMKNIPLLNSWDEADRRKLAVACLPGIKHLNGSEITPAEREKSERHFVRLFMDHAQPPARHEELVLKYGKLNPLFQVDIGRGFQEFAELKFVYGGRCVQQEVIRLTETIKKLKTHCGKLVNKHPRMLKLYHQTRDPDTDELVMDELFLDSLPLSRFDMKDGDEIHIDVTMGPCNPWWRPGIKLAP